MGKKIPINIVLMAIENSFIQMMNMIGSHVELAGSLLWLKWRKNNDISSATQILDKQSNKKMGVCNLSLENLNGFFVTAFAIVLISKSKTEVVYKQKVIEASHCCVF